MANLTNIQISDIRKTYEKLDARHQRAFHSGLREFTTEEIKKLFAANDADPSRWPTYTDLNDHLRNIATLRRMGWSHKYTLI